MAINGARATPGDRVAPSDSVTLDGKLCALPDGLNTMWLISSNLLDHTAMNAITAVVFNPYVGTGWEAAFHRKDIPLPTQDCCW